MVKLLQKFTNQLKFEAVLDKKKSSYKNSITTSFGVKKVKKCNNFCKNPKVFEKNAVIHNVGIGHVMRKLNGITINGEYLGNSVVINGLFRAICTISPAIMRDFVHIINRIEWLDEAVKISNFNCGFDSIDIEFENSISSGIASLYFKLINGEPNLIDFQLVLDDEDISELVEHDNTPEPENINESSEKPVCEESATEENSDVNPESENKESDLAEEKTETKEDTEDEGEKSRRQKISELKTKKIERLKQQKEKRQQKRTDALKKLYEENEEEDEDDDEIKDPTERRRQKLLDKKQKLLDARKKNSSEENSENSEITSENSVQQNNENTPENINNTDNPQGTAAENNSLDNNQSQDDSNKPTKRLDEMTDEEIENLSDEELAALEAELDNDSDEDLDFMDDEFYTNALKGRRAQDCTIIAKTIKMEIAGMEGMPFMQPPQQDVGGWNNQNFGNDFNNSGMNQGFNDFNSNFNDMNSGFADDSGGFNFSETNNNQPTPQWETPPQTATNYVAPDAGMYNQGAYRYMENSGDSDDLSDLYSDFYDSNRVNSAAQSQSQGNGTGASENKGPNTSEVDALKAELEALKAQKENKKELMTLDEFLAKQRELAAAKEKKRRSRLRIVGSREHVNASALDGGVFVAGNKVYKWGETKVLDE